MSEPGLGPPPDKQLLQVGFMLALGGRVGSEELGLGVLAPAGLVDVWEGARGPKWGFPKIRGPYLGALIFRIIVYWDLFWGPPFILVNSRVGIVSVVLGRYLLSVYLDPHGETAQNFPPSTRALKLDPGRA